MRGDHLERYLRVDEAIQARGWRVPVLIWVRRAENDCVAYSQLIDGAHRLAVARRRRLVPEALWTVEEVQYQDGWRQWWCLCGCLYRLSYNGDETQVLSGDCTLGHSW